MNDMFDKVLKDLNEKGKLGDLLNVIADSMEETIKAMENEKMLKDEQINEIERMLKNDNIKMLEIGLVHNGVTVGINETLENLFEKKGLTFLTEDIQEDLKDVGFKIYDRIRRNITLDDLI